MAELKVVTLEAGLSSSFGYLEKMSSVKRMSFHKEKVFESSTGKHWGPIGIPGSSKREQVVGNRGKRRHEGKRRAILS